MVFNNFLLQTFLNILYLNLCGQYMPMAVWIRVKVRSGDTSFVMGTPAATHIYGKALPYILFR